MKIVIEVEDFYLDEEDNLESGLKDYVKKEAIRAIYAAIQDKVNKEIQQEVVKYMDNTLSEEIAKAVSNGKVPSRRNTKTLVSIAEYVQECLLQSNNSNWQNFEDTIKKVAKPFCDELKRRYDLNFASSIVAELYKNQLIKDDTLKVLLKDTYGTT